MKLYTLETIEQILSPEIINKVREQYISDDDKCTILDLFNAPTLTTQEQQYIVWLYDQQLWQAAIDATKDKVGDTTEKLNIHSWVEELINQIRIRLEAQ